MHNIHTKKKMEKLIRFNQEIRLTINEKKTYLYKHLSNIIHAVMSRRPGDINNLSRTI